MLEMLASSFLVAVRLHALLLLGDEQRLGQDDGRFRELPLEEHHAIVRAEVADRGVGHGQVVNCFRVHSAVVATDSGKCSGVHVAGQTTHSF